MRATVHAVLRLQRHRSAAIPVAEMLSVLRQAPSIGNARPAQILRTVTIARPERESAQHPIP